MVVEILADKVDTIKAMEAITRVIKITITTRDHSMDQISQTCQLGNMEIQEIIKYNF